MNFIFPIVGAHFRPPAKAVLGVLRAGSALKAKLEPENPFDANAIKVCVAFNEIPKEHLNPGSLFTSSLEGYGIELEEFMTMSEIHLGYIPKEKAAELHAKYKLLEEIPGKMTFTLDGKPAIALSALEYKSEEN